MEINLVELWAQMGLPVKGVVIVLTLQAIASLAVAIDRVVLLARSGSRSRTLAAAAQPLIDRGEYDDALLVASKTHGSHLATLIHLGLKTFLDRRDAGDDRALAAERTRRALTRRGESVSTQLQQGMNVLASTGSTAPFVGLLGTVLGIIHAFQQISLTGSGGIGAIGASIGEALIVTGYGLCVAIPTVLLFNWLEKRISDYEQGLANACGDIVDRLEMDAARSVPISSAGTIAVREPSFDMSIEAAE